MCWTEILRLPRSTLSTDFTQSGMLAEAITNLQHDSSFISVVPTEAGTDFGL